MATAARNIARRLHTTVHTNGRQLTTRPTCNRIYLLQKRAYALPVNVKQPGRSGQERAAPEQKWSSRTLIALATFTGATTYILALLQRKPESTKKAIEYGDPLAPKTLASLRALFPDPEQISTDVSDLEAHDHSEWSSHDPEGFHGTKSRGPAVVVYAQSTADVQKLCKWATEYRIPLVPMSGGTSLEGQFSAPHGGVSVDLTSMDQIIKFRPEDGDIDVQPGVRWEELRDYLAPHGLQFPPDPGPAAMIGGMIGCGCSGTNAVRWGTMKDHVLSITAVLPDGRIVKTRQRPRKSSAGYDLTRLFVGSEGTLGIVTEATLKLARVPEETSVAVCGFKSIHDAAKTVADLFKAGTQLGAVEILDEIMMKAVNLGGASDQKYDEVPTLFFKFSGSKNQVKEDIALTQKLAKANTGKQFFFAKTQADKDRLWEGRKVALWSAMSLKPGAQVWVTDVVVPISALADNITATKKDLDASGLIAPIVGHVGDGNYHTLILFDAKNEEESKKATGLVDRMVLRALDAEGSCTGEHGVGLGKRQYLERELGKETVEMMRQIKQTIDPLNILNPGKIFPDEE